MNCSESFPLFPSNILFESASFCDQNLFELCVRSIFVRRNVAKSKFYDCVFALLLTNQFHFICMSFYINGLCVYVYVCVIITSNSLCTANFENEPCFSFSVCIAGLCMPNNEEWMSAQCRAFKPNFTKINKFKPENNNDFFRRHFRQDDRFPK